MHFAVEVGVICTTRAKRTNPIATAVPIGSLVFDVAEGGRDLLLLTITLASNKTAAAATTIAGRYVCRMLRNEKFPCTWRKTNATIEEFPFVATIPAV